MIRARANIKELFPKALRLFNKMIAAWNTTDHLRVRYQAAWEAISIPSSISEKTARHLQNRF